uniref:Secreted protein n=1 Tax=Cacopsylla melanoneura TaxID=428564 RepID=A0A8D8W6R9_9HEMI
MWLLFSLTLTWTVLTRKESLKLWSLTLMLQVCQVVRDKTIRKNLSTTILYRKLCMYFSLYYYFKNRCICTIQWCINMLQTLTTSIIIKTNVLFVFIYVAGVSRDD